MVSSDTGFLCCSVCSKGKMHVSCLTKIQHHHTTHHHNTTQQQAVRLKKIDPTKKVFFYFATDQQGIRCYAAGKTYNVSRADRVVVNPSAARLACVARYHPLHQSTPCVLDFNLGIIGTLS